MMRQTVEWSGAGSLLSLLLLATLCGAHHFLLQNTASQFLTRHRRANAMFEESRKGNLERECIEELCSKEEAREIFENIPETITDPAQLHDVMLG